MKPQPEDLPLPLLPSRAIVFGTLLAATIAAVGMFFARPATLEVDGQRVAMDVPPVTHARQAFVPVRAVAGGLGAAANFDPKTREISLVRGNKTLLMKLGEKNATLNGSPLVLSQAPFALRGRAMVVSTAIERAFGSKVRYDSARAKIDVITSETLEADATKDR